MQKLLTGKAYTHFVFISIQFMCIMKKMPQLAKWAIPIGLVIQWTFILMNKYYWQVPNKGSWALSYIAYFMLGAFIGVYYPKLKAWLVISRGNARPHRITAWVVLWIAWAAAGLGHVYIYYNSRSHGTGYNSTLYELLWNMHTYLGALVLLQLAILFIGQGWGMDAGAGKTGCRILRDISHSSVLSARLPGVSVNYGEFNANPPVVRRRFCGKISLFMDRCGIDGSIYTRLMGDIR